MDTMRERILENQVDELAGQVKQLREQMGAVVEIFKRFENSQLLNISMAELGKLMVPSMAAVSASRHGAERDTQHRNAELDRLIAERRRTECS